MGTTMEAGPYQLPYDVLSHAKVEGFYTQFQLQTRSALSLTRLSRAPFSRQHQEWIYRYSRESKRVRQLPDSRKY